jgi:N-acetylmuramic acid 6-phosphate etherase
VAPRRPSKDALSPTERVHPDAEALDLRSPGEVVRRLHREDLAAVKAVGQVLPQITSVAATIRDALARGGRLLYVGAGTSGRLGVLDAVECPPTFGTDPRQVQAVLAGGTAAMERAVEGVEDDAREGAREMTRREVGGSDVVVGISASATTPFVLGALREARRRGATTALVCCNPVHARAQAADFLIVPDTGPELIAGSTRLKAGTATKLVLNALSTAAMVGLGKVYRGRMVDLQPTNRKLKARSERMVADLTGLPLASARLLLRRAQGSPRVALAMHFGKLDRDAARARLADTSLRSLEKPAKKKRARHLGA